MSLLCIRMEFQKITNFLVTKFNDKDLPRFVTKMDRNLWSISVNKEIRIKTSMLRSDLSDLSDAYIVVYCFILYNGIITETSQVILFLLILNLLRTKQVLPEILTMLVMLKTIMMQTKLVKIKLKLLFH